MMTTDILKQPKNRPKIFMIFHYHKWYTLIICKPMTKLSHKNVASRHGFIMKVKNTFIQHCIKIS